MRPRVTASVCWQQQHFEHIFKFEDFELVSRAPSVFLLSSYNICLLNNKANQRVRGKLMSHFREWEREGKLAQDGIMFWQAVGKGNPILIFLERL